MTPGSLPVPPFPRWTGIRARLGPPRYGPAGLTANVSIRVTRRGRLWAAWRMLTRRGSPDGSA